MSFIDTTRPPGYAVAELPYSPGWIWQDGPSAPGIMYNTEADACRAAWRHWTASVLRGRRIVWRDYGVSHTRLAICGPVELWYMGGRGLTSAQLWGPDRCSVAEAFKSKAIGMDEAVARFAALVLAMKGMPT